MSPGSATRPRGRRLRPLDVLVLVLPVLALGGYVLGSALLDYARVRNYDDWWSQATSVRKFGWYRLRAALDLPDATRLRERIVADDPERFTLRVRVDRGAFAELSGDVGGHWGEWIEAPILTGDREVPAELRFRGDGSAHWTAAKKSFSLKTDKDQLYRGFRRLDFSLKDVLPQYLVNSLAREFDLLAPETAVVPVFVNDHYYGIFRFVEHVDESFLRRSQRMPGNVYRADAAERGEYFKDLPRDVFLNPVPWERVAANDRPGAPDAWGIRLMLDDLAGSTLEDHTRLMARLDRDELARLLALMLISGDPYHMSGVHNQLWYDDPVTGTLHPIVWDLRLLELGAAPTGSNWNRLWRELLRDPRVMDRALTELAMRLDTTQGPGEGPGLLGLARERVGQVHARYADHFAYDRLREGAIHPVGDPDSTLARLEGNAAELLRWMDDARVAACVTALGEGRWLVDVRSSGRATAVLEGFDTDAGDADPGSVQLFADVDRDGALGPRDRELPVTGTAGRLRLVPGERLPAGWTTDGAALEPAPLDYRFVVVAPGARAVTPVFSNGLRSTSLEAAALEAGAPLATGGAWHPWLLEELEPGPGREHRISGEVHLDRDLVVERGQRLVIEPGTTLSLDPDVSVLVKGELLAEGTAEAPILVQSAHPELPFGAFALQGPGADGSRLAHVTFTGGGGALLERVEYKGAVDVYAARGVVFRDCSFRDNLRCDDLINVVQGQVDLIDCRFEGANADAIDYDLSTGTISGCEVLGSGNDGLDLMTCSPAILDTVIRGSGDKGISVGEAARPRVVDVVIDDCVVGIEIKDLSRPHLMRTSITGCETGVLARRKNWRYAGAGRGTFLMSVVEGNGTDFRLLDGASLTVHPAVPGPLLAELELDSPFGPPRAGWTVLGGARRVQAVDGDLHAGFRDRTGAIGRALDWKLDELVDGDGGSGQVVAVTAAGLGARSGRVGLTVDGRTVEAALELDPDPSRLRITLVPVPEGALEIQAIAIEVDPEPGGADLPGGARLMVRSVELLDTHRSVF